MENRYDKYKDSGIAWIGEIPEHWEIKSIKTIFVESKETCNGENSILLSLSQYTGIKPKIETDLATSHIAESYEGYKLVKKGQFVMNIMLAWNGSYAVSDYDGIISPAYCVFDFRRKVKEKYFHYLLRTSGYSEAFRTRSKGIIDSRLRLYPESFYKFDTIIPSLSEQQSIAAYLDQKCGEIDELITLQEEMITKLQSYKQSVITEAVTKGLDKNVPLKDSGIEWIGEIPKHWEASKTLFVLSMSITDGPHTTPELFETGIPFVSAEAVSFGNGRIDFSHIRGYISEIFYQECCKKYIPQIDDIYMIKSGATTGRVAIVDADIKFTIWSPLAVFRCNKERMLPRFLFYQLQSNGYQKQIELNWSYGTQQNIGMRTLEKLILSVPPLPEQYSIADYLDQKCSEIDELISIKQQKIEKLKEYKKSLIFECVTGKRKVS